MGLNRFRIISIILVLFAVSCRLSPSLSGIEDPTGTPAPSSDPAFPAELPDKAGENRVVYTEQDLQNMLLELNRQNSQFSITDPVVELQDGKVHLVAGLTVSPDADSNPLISGINGSVEAEFVILVDKDQTIRVQTSKLHINSLPVPVPLLASFNSLLNTVLAGMISSGSTGTIQDITIDDGSMTIHYEAP